MALYWDRGTGRDGLVDVIKEMGDTLKERAEDIVPSSIDGVGDILISIDIDAYAIPTISWRVEVSGNE